MPQNSSHFMSGAQTMTVYKREGRNEMEEHDANDQNKSPEAPKDYKLPEAYDILEEQMKDSDWLERHDNNSWIWYKNRNELRIKQLKLDKYI